MLNYFLKKGDKEAKNLMSNNSEYNIVAVLLDLKNNGTLLNRKYSSNGTIKNSLIKTCSEYRSSTIYTQNKTIITVIY